MRRNHPHQLPVPGRGLLAGPERPEPAVNGGPDAGAHALMIGTIDPRPSRSSAGNRSPPTCSARCTSVFEPASPYAAASGSSPTPQASITTTVARRTQPTPAGKTGQTTRPATRTSAIDSSRASVNSAPSAASSDSLRSSTAASVLPSGRPHEHEVGALADREIADLVTQTQSGGAGARRQPQQMRRDRVERPSRTEHLHLIRHQPLAEHAEPGTGADVGPERHPHAGREMAAQREQPAPQERVARRAVGHGGAGAGEAAQLVLAHVDVVGEHRTRADEPVALVRLQIIPRPREQLGDEFDLGRVLVQVARDQQPVGRLRELTARRQQLLGARDREARADRVADQAPAVPALDQSAAQLEGAPRAGTCELRQQAAVGDDEPAEATRSPAREAAANSASCAPGSATRTPARSWSRSRPDHGRSDRPPWPRTRRPPGAPPRAASAGAANRAARAPSRRSPGSGDSGRGNRRIPAAGSRPARPTPRHPDGRRGPRATARRRGSAPPRTPPRRPRTPPARTRARTDCGACARPGPGRSSSLLKTTLGEWQRVRRAGYGCALGP